MPEMKTGHENSAEQQLTPVKDGTEQLERVLVPEFKHPLIMAECAPEPQVVIAIPFVPAYLSEVWPNLGHPYASPP